MAQLWQKSDRLTVSHSSPHMNSKVVEFRSVGVSLPVYFVYPRVESTLKLYHHLDNLTKLCHTMVFSHWQMSCKVFRVHNVYIFHDVFDVYKMYSRKRHEFCLLLKDANMFFFWLIECVWYGNSKVMMENLCS